MVPIETNLDNDASVCGEGAADRMARVLAVAVVQAAGCFAAVRRGHQLGLLSRHLRCARDVIFCCYAAAGDNGPESREVVSVVEQTVEHVAANVSSGAGADAADAPGEQKALALARNHFGILNSSD